MGISVEEAVKEIRAREDIYVLYSQVTRLPYVTCGEETYNDQAWFFADEESLKEFGKKKLDDKILLMGMKYEKKNFPRLYALLYSIGVNSLIWNKDGDQVEVDLEKVAREPDLSQIPSGEKTSFKSDASAFRYLLYAGAAPSGGKGREKESSRTGRGADRGSEKGRFPGSAEPGRGRSEKSQRTLSEK